MFVDYLRDFRLTKLARKPAMVIVDIVKEFYANAIEHKTMMSFVRVVSLHIHRIVLCFGMIS